MDKLDLLDLDFVLDKMSDDVYDNIHIDLNSDNPFESYLEECNKVDIERYKDLKRKLLNK